MERNRAILRILIPAHNEGERIAPTLSRYCEHFGDIANIMVIANACTDNTVDVVEALMTRYANLQVMVINGRIGKGGAIRAGLNVGSEQFVGFVDADGSTDAVEFGRLFEACVTLGTDGVIGSRWMPGAVVEPAQPALRRCTSRAFNSLVRVLFGLPFSDTQCGAKIFRRAAVREVLPSLELANFAFDIDLLFNMIRAGFQVVEMPTRWSDKIGTKVRVIPASLTMLQAVLRLRLQESWLFRLPFSDLLGSRDVIPVNAGTRVLVIGPRQGGWAHACVERLASRGCRITWAEDVEDAHGRLFWWYAFRSHREYDAIVEFASRWPSMIPAISAKHCFVLHDAKGPSSIGRIFSTLYRGARHLRVEKQAAVVESPLYGRQMLPGIASESAAGYILEQIGVGVRYKAQFQQVGDGWELHFTDLDTGSRRVQTLS